MEMKVRADVAAELGRSVTPDGPTRAGAAWHSCCTQIISSALMEIPFVQF